MITDKDITVVRLPEDPENPFEPIAFEAHLRLSSRHLLSPDFETDISEPTYMIAEIKRMLKQRILRKVYGDMVTPINELLIIAYQNPDVNTGKLQELERILKDHLP